MQNLEQVLQRLPQYRIQERRGKCGFMEESVEYLGHKIDATGLHTTTRKMEVQTYLAACQHWNTSSAPCSKLYTTS